LQQIAEFALQDQRAFLDRLDLVVHLACPEPLETRENQAQQARLVRQDPLVQTALLDQMESQDPKDRLALRASLVEKEYPDQRAHQVPQASQEQEEIRAAKDLTVNLVSKDRLVRRDHLEQTENRAKKEHLVDQENQERTLNTARVRSEQEPLSQHESKRRLEPRDRWQFDKHNVVIRTALLFNVIERIASAIRGKHIFIYAYDS